MISGNKLGQWLIPFDWQNRRDKELFEVKTIYKELLRREDLINQYYLKTSILKGESSVAELERYLREKQKNDQVNEIMIFKEKQKDQVRQPSARSTFEIQRQVIIDDTNRLALKYSRQKMDKIFGRDVDEDDAIIDPEYDSVLDLHNTEVRKFILMNRKDKSLNIQGLQKTLRKS